MNDGYMEMAFTLPVPCGEEAEEAARQYVGKMGMDEPNVAYYHELCPGYTFFVVYAKAQHTIDCRPGGRVKI
jgi:beta-lysine 5,6-aminomutase beta subunit